MHSLREWRRIKEISQKDVAQRIGVHVNTVINWEEHPERMSAKNGVMYAQAIGVPLEQIDFLGAALQNVESEEQA